MNFEEKYIKYKHKYNILKAHNMKEIYLIRHGETDWNKQGLAQGQEADIPMNEVGIAQATTTANYLLKYRVGDRNFDCIYASPMNRTKTTASIISNTIKCASVIYDVRLLERKQGKLSGKPDDDELVVEFNNYVRSLQTDDPIALYDDRNKIYNVAGKKFDIGYELDSDIKKRSLNFINDIVHSDHKKIIIVSHGGLLIAMIKAIFNINEIPRGDVKTNGANCWISMMRHDIINGFELVSPPNTLHLSLS